MMRLVSVVLALTLIQLATAATAADKSTLAFHPIKHGTFVITSHEATIYIDPVGEAADFDDFPDPSIILITDIHGDHLAPDVVKAVRGKSTVVIGPKAVTDKLKGATTLANGESMVVGDIVIEAIPMYNLTPERKKFHEKGRGNGYVITVDESRVYVSGDTEDIPEMRALEDIDYAFVCMNLPYTMTVQQAASAVLEMKPKVVIPYHYRGTEGLSDTEEFKRLVSSDDNIEVLLLNWYD